jgi:hypothetical protein
MKQNLRQKRVGTGAEKASRGFLNVGEWPSKDLRRASRPTSSAKISELLDTEVGPTSGPSIRVGVKN